MNQSAEHIRRFRLKRWRWVFIVLLLPFVAGIVAVKIRRHGLEKEIARELAAIRARGEPVTLEELDAWYPQVPDAENGAILMQQAFTQIRDAEFNSQQKVSEALLVELRKTPTSAETLSRIRTVLSKQKPALETLRLAVGKNRFRYMLRLSEGHVALPHVGELHKAIHLLALEAGLAMLDGNSSRAATALTTALKAADSLRFEPLTSSFHGRIRGFDIVSQQFASCLAAGDFTAADLSRIEASFIQTSAHESLVRPFVGERANMEAYFRLANNWPAYMSLANRSTPVLGNSAPSWWKIEALKARASFLAYRGVGNDAADHLHLIRSWASFVEAAGLPPQQQMHSMSNASWQAVSGRGTKAYIVSRNLLSVWFAQFPKYDLQFQASLRTFQAALALERFRLDSGRALPASLDELVPKHLARVPADPFTGQPLRYSRNGKSYVVYSVGDNGLDDHGDAKLDVTFIVEK